MAWEDEPDTEPLLVLLLLGVGGPEAVCEGVAEAVVEAVLLALAAWVPLRVGGAEGLAEPEPVWLDEGVLAPDSVDEIEGVPELVIVRAPDGDCELDGVGVCVGDRVGVPVSVALTLKACDAVAACVGVALTLEVCDAEAVLACVADRVGVGAWVIVGLCVCDAVLAAEGVCVPVELAVRVPDDVSVGLCVSERVRVTEGVGPIDALCETEGVPDPLGVALPVRLLLMDCDSVALIEPVPVEDGVRVRDCVSEDVDEPDATCEGLRVSVAVPDGV